MNAPVLRPTIREAFPTGCHRAIPPLAGRSDQRDRELHVDHDGCHLHGQPLQTDEEWLIVLRSGQLGQVIGAFALAWFADDGALYLARDGVGERTLFYTITPQSVLFATSIRELLLSGRVQRRLDPLAVATFLTYAYLPGTGTLAAGVQEVPPGELLCFQAGNVTTTPFWSIPSEPAEYVESEVALTARLRQGLEQAIFERLPTSGPVGAFLSGGLDSSLVVALMQRLHKEQVSTYSISFGPQYPNELAFSSLVAEHCRTDHHIVELSAEVILHYLDDTIALMSDPIGDPLTVPNALLFREVSQRVNVVLNGEGGDPCFGGPKNLPMVLAALYGEPQPFQRESDYLRAHLKCYDELREMLNPEYYSAVQDHVLERQLTPLFEDQLWQRYVTKLQMINVRLKGAHHILPKVDALSRPFGVQVRSPLFDRRLVELSFAIPPQWKLRGSIEKYLLKQSVRDLLPAAILNRPKSGMMVPVEGWFTGPLLPAARERIIDGLLPRGIFRNSYVERLLGGNLGGSRPRHGVKIWLLLTLEAWLRRVLDK